MDKTEQELAEKVGFECDKLGIRHRETGSVIWQANELTGCVDTLWELAISLLQENAKLSADFQSWLRKFESGELDSEQVKEKDARIKELKTALAKILSGRFGPFGVDKIARDVMAKGGSQ